MVTIQQDFSLNELNNLLLKYGDTELSFNKQIIRDDIARLKKELATIDGTKKLGAIRQAKINSAIAYLERILAKAENGVVKINWSINDNTLKSYPVEMKSIPEYKIYSTDYINLCHEKMVYLDYKELADIIAFEIMYRDLGETHQTMEDKLADIGIVSITDSSKLTEHFIDSPYELSRIFKAEDSPYLVEGKGKILDYFGNKEFDSNSYREVVSYSCMSAMAFITEALLHKCYTLGIRFKLCGVYDTGIYILIDNTDESDIQEKLHEAVYIRTFGRKFEVKPKMQVF